MAHKSAIRRKKALKKGRKLLMEVLTETQKMEYARTKSFTVCGADGKVYKLRKGGTTHQIDDSGLAVLSHCIHLPYSYIDEDTLVAVKLLLETDPTTFLKIANTSKLMGISVPALPQEMIDRAEALAGGLDTVNERFAQLSAAAARARDAAARLGRAFDEANEVIQSTVDVPQAQIQNAADYGDYARECEHQIVAEETGGLELPFATRQNHAARLMGQIEDIAGMSVAA
jgi:HAMP domain-containing protein